MHSKARLPAGSVWYKGMGLDRKNMLQAVYGDSFPCVVFNKLCKPPHWGAVIFSDITGESWHYFRTDATDAASLIENPLEGDSRAVAPVPKIIPELRNMLQKIKGCLWEVFKEFLCVGTSVEGGSCLPPLWHQVALRQKS